MNATTGRILFIYGTTAELIKAAPVLVQLEKRGASVRTVCTGQQADEIRDMADSLGLARPDLMLANGIRGRALAGKRDILPWLMQVGFNFARSYRTLRREQRSSRSVVLVHGDTFTTVIGALFGRLLGTPVGHIEAGLRSGDIFNPFPEELDRRAVAWLVDYHFAPGAAAAANLRRRPGVVIDTVYNTVRDSLELVTVDDEEVERHTGPLPEVFGIVSLHRFELLNDRMRLRETLKVLAEAAHRTPLVFIDHAVTAARIRECSLDYVFHDRFLRVPKLPYFVFVALVRKSAFAVTDSGGLQQESFFLGHPCLVHRARTETFEGLGENVIVSGLQRRVLEDFLQDPNRHRGERGDSDRSPSEIIVDTLVREGFSP